MATASFQILQDESSPRDKAAKIIQRTWRKYVCKEVFKHVQRMIRQCNQQDPRSLLRTVNPREAELLDPAAGVFLRFRLGGVFYKIFTYRPIVDICASSPKDYSHLYCRRYLTEQRDPSLNTMDRTGWYRRVENNNWRLFCCKLVAKEEPIDNFVVKKIDFNPSKMQRKEDVRKWRKRRKIEWLRRMYQEGRKEALEEESDQSDVVTIARKTTRDMMNSIKDKGEDEVLDWELDELLAWTSSLNFEEYMEEWLELACSHTSEVKKDRTIAAPLMGLAHLGAQVT